MRRARDADRRYERQRRGPCETEPAQPKSPRLAAWSRAVEQVLAGQGGQGKVDLCLGLDRAEFVLEHSCHLLARRGAVAPLEYELGSLVKPMRSVPAKVIDDELAGEVFYVKTVYPCLGKSIAHRTLLFVRAL